MDPLLQSLQQKVEELETERQTLKDANLLQQLELQRLRKTPPPTTTTTTTNPSPPVLSSTSPTTHIPTTTTPVVYDQDGDEIVTIKKKDLDLLHLKERAMDAVKEGITIASATLPDMPLIYFNEGFVRITGYSREDAIGKNCRFLQGEETDKNVVKLIRDSIKAGAPCVTQLMNYRQTGEPFVNYLSLTPIHDTTTGTLTHYVGVQADISELISHKKAELAAKHAAIQAAAATEAKSQFLARMSHEIRTPLNGMIAVGQLLAETDLSPAQWDLVNTIRCSGEALLTLITDILDFSRIEANKMVLSSAPFRLEAVIEAAMEIAGMQAAKKRLQVAYHISSEVPTAVVGDAQRLQQVLLNIVNNALKFTESGEVLLEVWCEETDSDSDSNSNSNNNSSSLSTTTTTTSATAPITNTEQQNPQQQQQQQQQQRSSSTTKMIHFSVRDTGIGIPPTDLDKLFQSFSQLDSSPTRRYGGSGLGLTISQKLTEAMGGKMWAESEGTGRGTTFRWYINIPIQQPTISQIPSLLLPPPSTTFMTSNTNSTLHTSLWNQPESGKKSFLAGKKILLAEPCDMVRQVVQLALHRWGCTVCAVSTEFEAISKLRLKTVVSKPPLHSVLARLSMSGSSGSLSVSTTTHPSTTSGGGGGGSGTATTDGTSSSTGQAVSVSHLSLLHTGLTTTTTTATTASSSSSSCDGPFDVVIMDVEATGLLHCLLERCREIEARRVIFTGWPGHHDPEHEDEEIQKVEREAAAEHHQQQQQQKAEQFKKIATSAITGLPDLNITLTADAVFARPPKALTEDTDRPGRRPLGYDVVTRPVRQERLKRALEEVLAMTVEEEEQSGTTCTTGTTTIDGTTAAAEGGTTTVKEGGVISPELVGSDDGSDAGCTVNSIHTHSSGGGSSSLRHAPLNKGGVNNSSSNNLTDSFAINSNRMLLLAEDNIINMKVALGILKRLGFTNVVTAVDGVAAVEAVEKYGGPDAFFAILMDLHMPRKGGIDAARDIHRMWPGNRARIVAVTADAFEDTRDHCIANGFSGWLAKPFRVEEFAKVMEGIGG